MNRDQALAKIKKCLALSRSANEHEAAAALRQAQALMREHAVSDQDVGHLDVDEKATGMRCAGANAWEVNLIHCIGGAFGCGHFMRVSDRLIGRRWSKQRYVVFIGVGAAPQVATYAYDVLSRQCAKARLDHVRKQPKSCKPITRTARGDEFAMGWVVAVRMLIQRFAGNPGDQGLIEDYIRSHHPELTTVKARNTAVGRNVRNDDFIAGTRSGKDAKLNQGIAGAGGQQLIGGA